MGAAMAQETSAEIESRAIAQFPNEAGATTEEKRTQAAETLPSINATPPATSPINERFSGVDWAGQQFWLVEMTGLLDRDAVTATWRDLRARFPEQMQNRTVLPRRQDRIGNASEDSASRYQLFIAKFPEKQMAEEFCAMLRAGQQRCGVVPSDLLAGKNLLNVASASGDSGSGSNVSSAAEVEFARVKAEQEAEEKARQEAEAKVAKLKAKMEAKAEAERLKAEQEAKAQAEKQALAEAKAEAARQKAEQKAQAEAEKKAAAEEKARQVAEAKAEAARLKAERKAQAEAEKQAAAEAKKAAKAEAEKLKAEQEAQAAAEAESSRVKVEQEAEEKARQEAEAKVAKLKAKQEAKAEAERLKAEQEAKAQAEKQALAEAKAEAARQKAEQKAQAEAEKKAAAEEKARQVAEAKAEAVRLKAEKKAQAEAEKQAAAEAKKAAKAEAARLKTEQEAQAAAEGESARVKAEQEAEEKARQEAEAKVAKLKARMEAKAEAARLKAEQKAKAEAEKQAAAEAKKAAKAEIARLKAEQKAKTEAEKLAATATKQVAVAELEAVELKTGQEVKQYSPENAEKKANAEEQAAAEVKQPVEAEAARASAEKKAQAEADAKAAKPKTPEGGMDDFVQDIERKKAEQKAQAEAKAAEEAQAAKLKAAKSDMMVDFAQKAVLNNPDVLSRWHNFQAAISETAAAEGGFYPHLDVTVDGGRERSQSPGSNYSVNTKNTTFTLTQLLYDGFATLNEVRRLNNAQLSRYYELLDASETAALDAVRTFYDVSRQRKLFELTEDNYVRHRTAFEQIKLKVEAGVGRRVDLEQAAGRLALSESNLTLDNANVHDVSARFQRIIGELPPAKIRKSPSQNKLAKKVLPNAADAVLSVAVESHPAILAAVENVRSSRYDLYGKDAKYQPTINLNVAQTHSKNLGGVDGITNNNSAKITLNWNLFNGGSDSARSAQYAKRLDAARDMRDKACRDIRMNLAIAYNDISKLKEQLNYMDQHQLSIEKARVAYQKQFEIGQRSLLDLLDTENELYQARRSYTNAEYDLAIAYARTLAGMGQLVSSLEISRLETADLPELLGISTDAAENCPPEAPIANNIRKDELDARAVEEAKAAVEAARSKEAAEKEKREAEDKEFLMTPGEAKAEKLKQEQGAKVAEDKTKQAAGTDAVGALKQPEAAAKQPEQQAIPSTMQEFKEQGVEPGNGKPFKDCPNCPDMVMVPAGKFMMGVPGSQKQKTISNAFAVGKYEVTFAEWDACVAGGGCAKYRPNDQGWGRGRQPVVNVNWNDAKKYVRWLSQKTGKNYRLLTETEWEYAARAGTTTAYPWGDAIGSGNANCNGCGSQWDNKQPAPVGSFKANAFGLYDMNGNVCEWTEGCINNNNCNVRVVRGGSWFYGATDVRSTHRIGDDSNARDYDDGFRVARELPQ
ncbi:MAG: TolC family outer membrane protein [Gallionella sp.]